jgi:hypothetical protein
MREDGGMRDDLNDFLNGLTDPERAIVVALRNVVRRTISQAEESFVWGGLSYHRPEIGGRVKGAVCHITAKRGQVRLEFIHGVRLTDPQGLLQGDRLSKRFIRITMSEEARRPEIVRLIQEAAVLDPTQWA